MDCRCRIFSWCPLEGEEGLLSGPPPQPWAAATLVALHALGEHPSSPRSPWPYFRVCGRNFFPSRQSASALSMSSCTSSAWGHRGVRLAQRATRPPLPAASPPPHHSGRSARQACSAPSPGTPAAALRGSAAGSAPSGCAAQWAAESSPAPPGGGGGVASAGWTQMWCGHRHGMGHRCGQERDQCHAGVWLGQRVLLGHRHARAVQGQGRRGPGPCSDTGHSLDTA